MDTARFPQQPVFTNADAIVCQLQTIRAGFALGLANIDQFGVDDDETRIISRCRQLAANLDWEIARARERAGRADRPAAALHLVN